MTDNPRQPTKGLLDALVLTPIFDLPGDPKFLDIHIQGLPGLRTTVEVAAVQELRQALDIILGPNDTEEMGKLRAQVHHARELAGRLGTALVEAIELLGDHSETPRLRGALTGSYSANTKQLVIT
jgi:hypothetical protein